MAKIIMSETLADIEHWVFPEINQEGRLPKPSADVNAPMNNPIGNKVINLPIVEKELAEAREKGFQEGFNQGYTDGQTQGAEALHKTLTEEIRKEWQDRFEEFANFVDRLKPTIEENTEQLETQLVDLSFRVAKWLVGQEISQKPELIMSIIRQVLAEIPVLQTNAKLFVNPIDHVLVRMVLGERYAGIIEDDADLARGESRLVCSGGEIDATFDSRLAVLAEEILGHDTNS